MARKPAIRWSWTWALLLLLGAASCFAGPLDTAGGNGVAWLNQQRNADDGSWGAGDAVKYVQTSEAVLALGALNQQGPAYYGGVAWLGNHAPANIDFTARRVLALGAANHALSADLLALQTAQNLAAPGNSGWGLSKTYQGSPLDTGLSLQALTQQGVTANVPQAVAYLVGTQLTGADKGWALGQETASDPVTTAQVLIALIPLKAVNAAVPAAVTNGLAALNAKITAASPTPQIALAVVANLRNDPDSAQAISLLNTLLGRQVANGSWGDDIHATGLALRAVAAGAGKDLAAQKQAVAVPDNALRAAINAALGHGALDALTVGQMRRLTSLTASGLGISDLTGLQYATNLTYLDVSNNDINSFDPLADLTGATVIATGNPGYVPPVQLADGDVPTLPEWGAIILGSLLLLISTRRQAPATRRRHD